MSYERRLVHFSGTLVPAAYLADVLTWEAIRYVLAAGAALAIVLELLRLFVGLEWVVYDRLTREYEQDNPAGYALAVVGSALVGWVFDPDIAVVALLLLTVVDPIAGILGDVDSADARKAPWVIAATFLVAFAIAVLLLPARAVVPVALVVVAADALKPRVFGFVIDDNFSIPVGAAVTAWFVLEFVPPLV
jgi:dolichol kinase